MLFTVMMIPLLATVVERFSIVVINVLILLIGRCVIEMGILVVQQ